MIDHGGLLPAALVTAYGILLPVDETAYLIMSVGPDILSQSKHMSPTAMDDVMRKTPPSAFALNVGKAALKRYIFPLTFVDQHCKRHR